MIKGSFTPSDYVTVTVTLTGGTFDLAKQIKGAARQRYCDSDVIAWCEQTFRGTGKVDEWILKSTCPHINLLIHNI